MLDALEKAGLTNVQPASQNEEDKRVLNPANWSVVSIGPGAEVRVKGSQLRLDQRAVQVEEHRFDHRHSLPR